MDMVDKSFIMYFLFYIIFLIFQLFSIYYAKNAMEGHENRLLLRVAREVIHLP